MPARRTVQYPEQYAFQNASNPLTITTYEGSGTTTEPDIYDFKNKPFQGYRFWMVNCPYKNLDSQYENPSIWCSNDGTTWVIPSGLTNPIVAYPGAGVYNSDPSITYDPNLGKLRVYYRRTSSTDTFRMIESVDGVNWINDQQVLDTGGLYYLSPQGMYDPVTNSYFLWAIFHGGCGSQFNAIYRYVSTDGITWTNKTLCTVNQPTKFQLWHFDLQRFDNSIIGAICAFPTGGSCTSSLNVYFIRSLDANGLVFQVSDKPILGLGSSGAWDSSSLYESCLINVDGTWKLWYSGLLGSVTKLGLATYTP